MDVSLVLTHRCNLACGYCYAGDHYGREIDDETVTEGVRLLYSDGCETAQLGFFGGEPFLHFDAMRRAVELGRREAVAVPGRRLLLQCTTNGTVLGDEQVAFIRETGMRVTVSIDGIRDAHDIARRCAGGQSSFDRTAGGLRRLVAAGCDPDALMVITPATALYTYRSVGWLWAQGVRTVRANLDVAAAWTRDQKDELREELLAVSYELLARRLRGEQVTFQPFEAGMRRERAKRGTVCPSPAKRRQVTVATGGNLYPCAPMVGEDRDDGPEAALRLGHLGDGAERVRERIDARGAGCGDGKGCACAAYLETGDRDVQGPNGRWFAAVCEALGAALATELDRLRVVALPPPQPSRRPFLIGMAAAVGGVAIGGAALWRAAFDEPARVPDTAIAGEMIAVEPPPPPPGAMIPEPPPPPEDVRIEGGLEAIPEPEPVRVKGDMAVEPEPEPEPMILGEMVDVDGDME